MTQLICPTCGNILTPDNIFCPKCGTKVSDSAGRVSFGKQISIYSMSLFLPPFGLIWTFKYLNDPNRRIVGFIAGAITIISLILTVWLTMGFFQGIQSQMSQYSNVGL